MKRYGKCCLALVLSLLAGCFSGCGERAEAEIEKSPYAAASGMEETPVADYVVLPQLPNILADTVGYAAGYEKTAVVKGSRLPAEFHLVDAATGETVYTGSVEEQAYSREQEISWATADFSEFDTPGTYYLQCGIVGESCRFEIRDDLYGELFREVYEELKESCQKRELPLAEAMALLAAYEWYGSIFPDVNGDDVPDILRELRGWVTYTEENRVQQEEEMLYAAFLAKFSYLYQKYDHEYATDCLKRASTVYGQAQTDAGGDADTFLALTELYRAAGLYTYRNQIVEYKPFFENNSSYLEESAYLYAAMTYMATRQKVDVELCESLMKNLMDRSEELSQHYADMVHPVAAKNNGEGELLKCAEELSCANYIMNNYQYTGIMADFLHYLMGRNLESVCFYENGENRVDYLLLLAHMAFNRGTEQ